MGLGRIQGLPKFWGTPYYLIADKATNCKYCTHILRLNRNKNPIKISLGVVRGIPENFQGTHI